MKKNNKWKIKILSLLLLSVHAVQTMGQTTYHDSEFMNQFTIAESGVGKPPSIAWVLHPEYRATAMGTNKMLYRSSTMLSLNNQLPYAEDVDSALSKRKKEEAFNVLDRENDIVWASEKGKIESIKERFMSNINRIQYYGGSVADREYWLEIYKSIDCGLKVINKAYLSNSQRQKEYLSIYKDFYRRNDDLLRQIAFWRGLTSVNISSGIAPKKADKNDITSRAFQRWKMVAVNHIPMKGKD